MISISDGLPGGVATDIGDSARNGFLLLRSVATAMVRLQEIPDPASFTLPYPPEAQRALDRTALTCILRGATPPFSVPDLVRWCATRAVADWPVDLPEAIAGVNQFLVDNVSRTCTQLCFEWMEDSEDAAASSIDKYVLRTAEDLCREEAYPEAYIAFRRLLVERPALSAQELLLLGADVDNDLSPLLPLLGEIYAEASAGYERNGVFVTCRFCGILLTPVRDGGWWCERDECRTRGKPLYGREMAFADGGGVRQLTRPLRQWATSPGLTELALERGAAKLGLKPEVWPGYGAYSLRVELPDGQVWAVRVEDRSNPVLLGRRSGRPPSEPPYDCFFIVVPRFRMLSYSGYGQSFRSHLRDRSSGYPMLQTVRGFLNSLRNAIDGALGKADTYA